MLLWLCYGQYVCYCCFRQKNTWIQYAFVAIGIQHSACYCCYLHSDCIPALWEQYSICFAAFFFIYFAAFFCPLCCIIFSISAHFGAGIHFSVHFVLFQHTVVLFQLKFGRTYGHLLHALFTKWNHKMKALHFSSIILA